MMDKPNTKKRGSGEAGINTSSESKSRLTSATIPTPIQSAFNNDGLPFIMNAISKIESSGKSAENTTQILEILATTNVNGLTALHIAAKLGDVAVITKLVLLGSKLEAQDKDGRTPLHLAACYNKINAIQTLVELGADIEAQDRDRETPLHYAAENNQIATISKIVELGADIKARDDEGRTPLHIAAECNYINAIEKLVSLGANIEAKDNQERTPLHRATSNDFSYDENYGEMIRTLVRLRANLEAKDYEGRTPLHLAAIMEENHIIKTLLSLGADIKAKDKKGRTPLHLAVKNNSYGAEIIEELVNSEADIEAKDEKGRTPLHLAALSEDSIDAISKLVELGADIKARDNENATPLHLASRSGNIEAIQWFIYNSPKSFYKGLNDAQNGHDALSEAIRYTKDEVVDLILQKIPNQYHITRLGYLLYIMHHIEISDKQTKKDCFNILESLIRAGRSQGNLVLETLQIYDSTNDDVILHHSQKLQKYVSNHRFLASFIAHGVKFDLPSMPELKVAIEELYGVGETYLDAIMSDPNNTPFAKILSLRSNSDAFKTLLFSNASIPDYLAKKFYEYDGKSNNLMDVLADTILTEKYPQAKSLDEAKACYIVEKLGNKILDLYSKDAAQTPDERTIALRKNSLLTAVVPIILQHKDSFEFPVVPAQLEILLVARGLNALQNEASKKHPNFTQSFKDATESAFKTWEAESANPNLATLKNKCRYLSKKIMELYAENNIDIEYNTKIRMRNKINGLMFKKLASCSHHDFIQSKDFLSSVGSKIAETILDPSSGRAPNFKTAIDSAIDSEVQSRSK
jgi:ankyrin repeat protein